MKKFIIYCQVARSAASKGGGRPLVFLEHIFSIMLKGSL
jgi:hypothetical protein